LSLQPQLLRVLQPPELPQQQQITMMMRMSHRQEFSPELKHMKGHLSFRL
jgi:hypothetical protein